MALRSLAFVLFLCAACATTQKDLGPMPPHPAPRSSLDAVLRHADQLQLTDGQYAQLHEIDDAREMKVQQKVQEREEERNKITGPPRLQTPGVGIPVNVEKRKRAAESLAAQKVFDETDVEAFYSAEAFLSPKQMELARAYASGYRDALNAWREAMKARGAR